jgi:hypothetical protein
VPFLAVHNQHDCAHWAPPCGQLNYRTKEAGASDVLVVDVLDVTKKQNPAANKEQLDPRLQSC